MIEADSTSTIDDTEFNVVIVDDNANNLRLLSGMLEQAGFKARPAASGELALRSIAIRPPDLILLDIRMPGMDGYEVCKRLKADRRTRDIPVIFISALQEAEDKITAFQAGGVDYVAKPFNIEEVVARVRSHVQLYRMQYRLEQMVAARTEELRVAYSSLQERDRKHKESLFQTIAAISITLEKRDPYTAGHQKRVAVVAAAIAADLGLDDHCIEGIRLGALIHDIGKINIPAEILTRPGRLSDTEMKLVIAHSEIGHEIIRGVDLPWPVADMVRQHHERLNGSGYPDGLGADRICREAKILMVADVVEAIASHRPYRPALGIDKALAEIRSGRGERYDPEVVDSCLRLFEQQGFLLEPVDIQAYTGGSP
ncbi:MAG: response regulator [Candidatus Thiodiazotropha sp. (ex Epidulcina cf. delphinae)]|nr:response regulator [Candidatus Thiodiazotropha sp. (ex Epidulcina cf. delphinae)]